MAIAITLHVIAAILWVGGMFFAWMVLRPVAAGQLEPPARLTLWRNGKSITRTVTLGERGEKTMAAMQPQGPTATATVLGMALQAVGEKEAAALGLDKVQGLIVVDITPDSPAASEGVRQGDVILQANQQDVNSTAELESVIKRDKQRGAVMLLIRRQGQNIFVALPLDKN